MDPSTVFFEVSHSFLPVSLQFHTPLIFPSVSQLAYLENSLAFCRNLRNTCISTCYGIIQLIKFRNRYTLHVHYVIVKAMHMETTVRGVCQEILVYDYQATQPSAVFSVLTSIRAALSAILYFVERFL